MDEKFDLETASYDHPVLFWGAYTVGVLGLCAAFLVFQKNMIAREVIKRLNK